MKHCETVVVGGGIIGSSIAYYLAKQGVDVTLFEMDDLGSGVSSANQGYLGAALYTPPLLDLVLASHRLYGELVEELPFDIEFDNIGSLFCITRENQWPNVEEHLQRSPLPLRVVDDSELRKLEPRLSKNLLGALTFSEDSEDYLVNPMMVTYAFAHAAKTLGANIQTFTEVKDITVKEGKVESVVTNRGEVKTDFVVNAAGAWSSFIGEMVGIRIPVRPQRGQLLVTERMSLFNYRNIADMDYLTTAFNPVSMMRSKDPRIRRGVATGLLQTRSGNWLIGTSRDFAGFDRRTTLETLNMIVRRAMTFLPYLKNINFIRTFAGARPFSPDALPILGKVEGIEGFLLATGHGGAGVNLAPITGKLISEIVTKGKPSIPIEKFAYSHSRFDSKMAELVYDSSY